MKQIWNHIRWLVLTAIGSAVFALGFALFLIPNEINTGGISGLAMILRELLGFGSVGILTLLMNIPLFLIGGLKIGRRFFAGSLVGMVVSSVLMDVFSVLSFQTPDPLLGGLYGGVICGTGLGLVFLAGASTGGSDIVVRLVKKKYRNLPIVPFIVLLLLVSLVLVLFYGMQKYAVITKDGVSVELRGNDKVNVATWSNGGFAYSVSAKQRISETEVAAVVSSTF